MTLTTFFRRAALAGIAALAFFGFASSAFALGWQEILRVSGNVSYEDDENGGYHGGSNDYVITIPSPGVLRIHLTGTSMVMEDEPNGFSVGGDMGWWNSDGINDLYVETAASPGTHVFSVSGASASVYGDYELVIEAEIITPEPPTFWEQPQSLWVAEGQSAVFSADVVSYEGTATYQWQRLPGAGGAWTNVTNGGAYSGATTESLTVSGTTFGMNGDQFRCVATNSYGAATSDSATLNVATLPVFVTQPLPQQTAYENDPVHFHAVASSNPAATYHWQMVWNGSWADIATWDPVFTGVTTTDLTVVGSWFLFYPARQFRCVATTLAGSTPSNGGTVTVIPRPIAPVFTVQPVTQTADANWSVVLFSAAAMGTAPVSYQWQANSGGGWYNLANAGLYSGATSPGLIVSAPPTELTGTLYQCVATNSAGSGTSNTATLWVQPHFTITSFPADKTVAPGQSASFTTAAIGDPAPYYEWERLVAGEWRSPAYNDGTGGSYSGVFTSTLTISGAPTTLNGALFRCRVTSGSRTLFTDSPPHQPAKLTVDSNVPPSSQTINFPTIANHSISSPPFAMNATATSGLPVTYSVVSGPVSLSGNTVTILNAGDVTIRASQAGNASYLPAQDVDRSFSIVSSPEGAPIADQATHVTSIQFVANWSPVAGATGYRLDVATDESFTNLVIRNRLVSGTAYLVNNVSTLPETIVRPALSTQTYYYRVRAETTLGTSPNSNVISIGQIVFLQGGAPDSVWLSGIPDSWTRDANNNPVAHYSGLIDEVIPVGTDAGFNYFISDWSYYSPTSTFTFDWGWPFNDGWAADGVNFTDEDGNSQRYSTLEWIDGFTFYGDPQWYKFYIAAEYKADAGYDYDIAYSTADELTGADLGSGVQSGGRLNSLPVGGWQLIQLPNPFNRSELNHGRFYLIRRGLPFAKTTLSIGGTTIGIGASGSSAGPITVPGIGTVEIGSSITKVTLPDGTVISIDRTTGQVLKDGYPIPIGDTTVAGIGIKIDSTGGELSLPGGPTVRVNPDGSGAIKLPGGAGISVSNTGAVSVNLPSGVNPAIVKAVDLLEKILQAGKGVKISVVDVLGVLGKGVGATVPFPSSGVIQDILLGTGKNGGIFRVGVQIDDTHTFWFDVNLNSTLQLLVDANRDGVIASDDTDATSANKPYRFWLNDDIDRGHIVDGTDYDQEDISPTEASANQWVEDWKYNTIQSKRDLEDYSRIMISARGLSADLYLGLKWTDVTGAPSVKLYRQYDTGTSYLTDDLQASLQLPEKAILNQRYPNDDVSSMSAHTVVTPGDLFVLPAGLIDSLGRVSMLFEGCTAGTGQLKVVIVTKNGTNYTEIGDGGSVWLDLKNIKDMYEHWTVGQGPVPYGGGAPSALTQASSFTYTAQSVEESKYILYVHGWNMEQWDKERFAETAYKRLWWQGYKGRFGLFSWPTTNGFDGLRSAILDGNSYDRGEFSAWRSAALLEQKLVQLNSQYRSLVDGQYVSQVYLLAHSMGNVVAGEALRRAGQDGLGVIVRTYVASQSALPVQCYNGSLADNLDPDVPYSGVVRVFDGGWPQTANAYKSWLTANSAAVAKRVNFFNINDYALWRDVWQLNQRLKPDHPDSRQNSPDPKRDYVYLDDINQPPTETGFGWQRLDGSSDPSDRIYQGIRTAVLHLGTSADVKDRYEIMAMACESRSKALGGTSFNEGLDASLWLGSVWPPDPSGDARPYSRHKWHSAQFRSTNMLQKGYWQALLGPQGFNIITPP